MSANGDVVLQSNGVLMSIVSRCLEVIILKPEPGELSGKETNQKALLILFWYSFGAGRTQDLIARLSPPALSKLVLDPSRISGERSNRWGIRNGWIE